jgi:DNA invertase Pin-like site-specific DNA recombinase
LREALAACRPGDTLVVTKLDRLARSLPDARDIVEELTSREVSLSIGGSVHDPSDPVGRLLFNVLAMVAEFEANAEFGITFVMPRRRLCRHVARGPALVA